jgi:late competence protein required for DNA uptake (superfamily II DNA/RNA helicase)
MSSVKKDLTFVNKSKIIRCSICTDSELIIQVVINNTVIYYCKYCYVMNDIKHSGKLKN